MRDPTGSGDIAGPRGAPTITYVAVCPQSEYKDPDAKDVTIVNSHTIGVQDSDKVSHKYLVQQVFGETPDDDVIYHDILENVKTGLAPLRACVKNSVSACAMVMGSFATRKREVFQGDGQPNSACDGIVGWAGNKLFELLEEEQKTNPFFRACTVSVSFVEIFDEVLVDLLEPSVKGLQLTMDPFEGFQVTPLTKKRVECYDDVMDALDLGIKNRNTKRFQSGNAAQYSSAVFEFHIAQQRGLVINDKRLPQQATYFATQRSIEPTTLAFIKTMANPDDAETLETVVSRLVLVEVPATDDLVDPPMELRAKHGPFLHKSLLTFVEVAKTMADQKTFNYAPYRQSRLTQILEDIFGGNFLVVTLACVAAGEPEVSVQTLDLAVTLGKLLHFPNENREMLQGLLAKYRTALGHIEDRLLECEAMGLSSTVGMTKGGTMTMTSRSRDADDVSAWVERSKKLEADLLEAAREKNQARDDALKIFKVLELLKAKYNTLVDEKARQTEDLINAEEAKLKVTRSLLELKLEISKMQEGFEKEKYDLSSQLLTVKNEAAELEIRFNEAHERAEKNEEELQTAKRERDDMQVELSSLHTNLMAIKRRYTEEKAKTVEIGAELLSLHNAKEALGRANAELEAKLAKLMQQSADMQQNLEKAGAERTRFEHELAEKSKELEETRAEKIKAQLELERVMLNVEHQRINTDKTSLELLRGSEADVRKLQRAVDELEKRSQALDGDLRRERRKVQDLTHDKAVAEEEAREMRNEKDAMELAVNEVTEKYRRKMTLLLDRDMREMDKIGKAADKKSNKRKGSIKADPASSVQEKGVAATSKAEKAGQPDVASDGGKQGEGDTDYKDRSGLVADLLRTYKDKEARMDEEFKALKERVRHISRKNKGLFEKCRKLLHILEDVAPAALRTIDFTIDMQEDDTRAEHELQTELDGLRLKLEEVKKELAVQQEKNFQLADLYMMVLKKLEAQKAESDRYIGMLEALQGRNPIIRSNNLQTDDTAALTRQHLLSMAQQRSVPKQTQPTPPRPVLDRTPTAPVPPAAKGQGSPRGHTAAAPSHTSVRIQLAHAPVSAEERAVRVMASQSDCTPRKHAGNQAAEALSPWRGRCIPGVDAPDDAGTLALLRSENEYLRRKLMLAQGAIGKTTGGAGSASAALLAQLQEAERRHAAMVTKCAIIEEEGASYRRHMQGIVSRYQGELRRVKGKGGACTMCGGVGMKVVEKGMKVV